MAKATITNKEIIFALRFICFILSGAAAGIRFLIFCSLSSGFRIMSGSRATCRSAEAGGEPDQKRGRYGAACYSQ